MLVQESIEGWIVHAIRLRGGVLTQAQGQPLIAAANAVIHSLGG